jgi:hypothetical protein
MYGESYRPNPDGTYHVDALRPGHYHMKVVCFGPDPRARATRVIALATEVSFEVPASVDKAVDLPPIPTRVLARDDGL